MSNATNTAGTIAPTPVLTPRREVWLSLKGNRGAMAALILILLVILCAILAPLLAPHDYRAQNVDNRLDPAGLGRGRLLEPIGPMCSAPMAWGATSSRG